jgi:hypothetical protein
MKEYSEAIKSIVNSDVLNPKKGFSAAAKELGIATGLGDLSFPEIVDRVSLAIAILKIAAEKDLLDPLLPDFRQNLHSTLVSIQTQTEAIFIKKEYNDASINEYINSGILLLKLINESSLEILVKYLPDLKIVQGKAKELLDKLDEQKQTLSKTFSLLDSLEKGYTVGTQQLQDIAAAKDKLTGLLKSIEGQKADIDEKIGEVNEFYTEEYRELFEKITSKEEGFDAIITHVSEKHEKIKAISQEATTLHANIKSAIDKLTEQTKKLKDQNDEIEELADAALDEDTGIESQHKAINDIKVKVDELYTKTKESQSIVADLEIKIKAIHANSEKALNEITFNAKTAKDRLTEIENVYSVAIPKMRGGIIDDIRKQFQRQQGFWLRALGTAVLLTTALAYYIYYSLHGSLVGEQNSNFIPVFLRYATLSPLIFIIIFCSRQYKTSRISFEKYTYKTMLSFTVMADIVELKNKFPNDKNSEKEILAFAMDKMNKLYDEPYYDEIMKLKVKMKMEEIKYGPVSERSDSNTFTQKTKP